jgi:hypothetical protein
MISLCQTKNNPTELSRYYANGSQHKAWNKMVNKRNIILDFTRGDAVANF